MVTKQTYFISLDKETISEVSVPDTTEYEIYATEGEVDRIKLLMEENDQRDFWFAARNILVKPFAEKEVDVMRMEDDENLMEVYQLIYRFGTEETQKKLNELGVFPYEQ